MIYVVMAGFFAFLAFATWSGLRARKDGQNAERLKTEEAGRHQREEFDEAGDDWDAGGGLAGRVLDTTDNNDPPTAA